LNQFGRRRLLFYWILWNLIGGGVLFMTSCSSATNPTGPPAYPIDCVLAANETFSSGDLIELRFTLHNGADRPLYFLSWYTPFEGLAGEIFSVERNGEPVPYEGILAKRGEPEKGDYVAIEVGKDVSALVNLAEGYDLSMAGEYKIIFTSHLYDVTDDEKSIPRSSDVQQPQELRCNEIDFQISAPMQ
jgi:peptidyl-Lys metalloendopeptidase